MRLGFENIAQLRQLFLLCGMGFLLGCYYDIFRLLRHILRLPRWRVFLDDCIFASTSAVIVFLFLLALNGGVLRWYVGLGLLVGFFAYRRTVGCVLLKVVLWLLRCGETVVKNIKNRASVLLKPVKAFLRSKITIKNRKKFKKTLATGSESVV